MSVLAILAVVAGVIGIAGSVIPGLPGPPLGWLGMLLAYLAKGTNGSGDPMTTKLLVIWLIITVIVSILDYVIPAYFTRLTGGSKVAARGAIAGLFIGLFVPPIGIIVGTLLGAFLADFFIEDKGAWESFKSSIGAFMGFLGGTGIKLIASGFMLYYIIVYL
ncbi:MAG: DUF456 domain-containing protein [Bacteroidales bacterium]|jgi:hypothetical protein|nr:DUF456 domain-containing protein [Bacteroidales bacterium]MBR4818235.1 DUF456 domain-containing protein [Bacteroidales bacterium]MBR5055472.1 DUF456 domain-containing protein [Bacteroidales bacterium]